MSLLTHRIAQGGRGLRRGTVMVHAALVPTWKVVPAWGWAEAPALSWAPKPNVEH